MVYRRLSAHYVFPLNEPPIRHAIINLDESGQIIDIERPQETLREQAKVEFYNGILVPGFVNAHCHLELSYLKGLVDQHTTLPGFLKQLTAKRQQWQNMNKMQAIEQANRQMQTEGIVAVGDIANTADTITVKKQSPIYYHSFVELFDIGKPTDLIIQDGLKLLEQYRKMQLPVSLTPHAPYTVSEVLFRFIADYNKQGKSIVSLHNQETAGENSWSRQKEGPIREMYEAMNTDYSSQKANGKNSLANSLAYFSENQHLLLVHNTFSQLEDIALAEAHSALYWVLCPKANLYIENRLPDVELFVDQDLKLCLGTDSLAANNCLSILDEMKTLQEHFPKLPLGQILQWACYNGAHALQIDDQYGSLEVGKRPGINLINHFDFNSGRLTEQSTVKRLV